MLYQSTLHHEIADILQISKSSAENDLHQLGYINHFDVLLNISKKKNQKTKKHLFDCISVCDSLMYKNILFLKQIVTGDEKCSIQYYGMEQIMGQAKWTTTNTKGWSSSKEKWCCVCGGIGRESSEFLLENPMINSHKYCSQLD